jgi:hypothetical protein
MFTLLGEIPEEQLEKTVLREKIPCGECITTTYRKDKQVVRQDIRVEVDKATYLRMLKSQETN